MAMRLVVALLLLPGLTLEAQGPPGGDAWTVEVSTRGGFGGGGRGGYTVMSDGSVSCGGPRCVSKLTLETLRTVTVLVAAVEPVAVPSQPASFCSDCVETVVTLRRREGDAVRISVFRWNDSQRPPAAIRELLDALASGMDSAR